MYQISRYSNKIKNILTDEVFEQDDRLQQFTEYLIWLSLDKTPEKIDYFEGELEESKRVTIQQIDEEYTIKISELMRKSVEKFVAEGEPIPQSILDERNMLREECNQKIAELGVDVDTYRKTNKETILLK